MIFLLSTLLNHLNQWLLFCLLHVFFDQNYDLKIFYSNWCEFSIFFSEENPAENPWIILFTRLIEKNSADKFLELLKLALHKVTFGLEARFSFSINQNA